MCTRWGCRTGCCRRCTTVVPRGAKGHRVTLFDPEKVAGSSREFAVDQPDGDRGGGDDPGSGRLGGDARGRGAA